MEACNLPFLRIVGYEADDVIATYTKQAAEKGHKVTIVSVDKDLMQLCNDRISLYDTTLGQSICIYFIQSILRGTYINL